ncbi:MAG: MFS transporter [Pseudobdellovibrionaceae bacterium]
MSWKEVGRSLKRPDSAVMLGLGFASGLPFMLVGNTLGYWLRESGITLTTIGFLSWVGFAYTFKFLWAPLVDKVRAPLLGRFLGLRRGWMLFAQILVMLGLLAMASLGPEKNISLFTAFAALAAFASATLDVVVDAWRIEASESSEDMALLSSSYQLGYRAALLLTDALILIVAGSVGWSNSYIAMAAACGIGITATFFAREPVKAATIQTAKSSWNLKSVRDAVFGPLVEFFKHHGKKAILILAAVCLYRLADFVMGPMNNPFYADLGISKEAVGAIRGSVGLVSSIAGIAVAGICAVRFGLITTLLIGAVIGPLSNLTFSVLALNGPSTEIFSLAMAIDNFSGGFAGVALVGYMSSLTSLGYTATQYALLSSFYTLLGKFLKGFSGITVDTLKVEFGLMHAYAFFFAGTALIGIPAVVLCLLLAQQQRAFETAKNK